MDGAEALGHGPEGALADPSADAREWFSCFLYADGELVLTAATEPEPGRELKSSGRMYAQARYRALGARPWDALEDNVVAVEIAEYMTGCACLNMDYWFYDMDYWFYGHGSLSAVSGLGSLNGTREMRYAFSGCAALEELELSGFDESALEDVDHCFSGCSALATIWAGAEWELPSGCAGFAAIDGCGALVGGAGMAYDEDRIAGAYMRIDSGEAAPGYLTVKS